jgi:hypothetical protein
MPLRGPAGEYVGKKYTLVRYTTATNYSSLTPALAPVTWSIDGLDFQIVFRNDLAKDGSVTVTDLRGRTMTGTCVLIR